MNYDGLRAAAKNAIPDDIGEMRAYISKLQKAQRAGEKALDMHMFLAVHTCNCLVFVRVSQGSISVAPIGISIPCN